MGCTYSYNGKQYTEAELKKELLNLNDTVKKSQPSRVPIKNIKDFINYFIKHSTERKIDEMDTESLSKYILLDMMANKVFIKNVEQYVYRKWSYPTTRNGVVVTEKELSDYIKKEIVPNYQAFEKALKDNFIKFHSNLSLKDIVFAAQDSFGAKYFSESALKNLIGYTGLYGNTIKEIVKYSDLKRHKNDRLRKLYKEEFAGFDPIVIIHDITKDNLDISLIDMTTLQLGNLDDVSGAAPLLNTFRTDKIDGTMFNTGVDIRQLMLGMQLMAMQSVDNIKLRNFSVLKINPGTIRNFSINDIDRLIKNIKEIKNTPELMAIVSNPEIAKVLNNEKLYETKYAQSYIARVRTYLLEIANDSQNLYHQSAKKQYDVLIAEGLPKSNYRDVLKRMLQVKAAQLGDAAPMNADYQMISMALHELDKGHVGWINKNKDIHRAMVKLLTMHGVDNDIVQNLIQQTKLAKRLVVDTFDTWRKSVVDSTKEVIQNYEMKHIQGLDVVSSRVFRDIGSQYFYHLYKKKQMIALDDLVYNKKNYKKGDKIDALIPVPEIHWDKNDPETKAAMEKGEITEFDLKYANIILDKIESEAREDIRHEKRVQGHVDALGKDKFTDEEVEKELASRGFKRGNVPVYNKSLNELLFSGKFSAFKKAVGDVMSDFEILFEDQPGQESELDRVSGSILSLISERERYKNSGVFKDVNGEWYLKADGRNESMSTNLERVATFGILGNMRRRIYEERVVPVYNYSNAILAMLKQSNQDMPNNKEIMRLFYEKVVLRKSNDPKSTVPFGESERDLRVYANAAIATTTFSLLAFKTSTALKSAIWNNLNSHITALATSISNIGLNSSDPNYNRLPKYDDLMFGYNILFKPTSNENGFRKALAWGQKYGVVNREEIDFMENFFLVQSKKAVINQQLAQMLNQGTDIAARLMAMVSYMHRDGSWNAHSIEIKTGQLKYDEKKDQRWYTKEGKEKTELGENLLKKAMLERMKEQGMTYSEATTLDVGYDYETANNFKWYADKYIIGSMTSDTKPMLSNAWYWRFVTQFRLFSFEKMFEMGVGAKERASFEGGEFIVEKDENGNPYVKQERLIIEGIWQSWNQAYVAFRKAKNKADFATWWKQQPAIRRQNLVKSMLKAAMGFIIYGITQAFPDDDDKMTDDDKRRWNMFVNAYGDLSTPMILSQIIKDPIPFVNTISDLEKSITKPGQLLKYTGGAGEAIEEFTEDE